RTAHVHLPSTFRRMTFGVPVSESDAVSLFTPNACVAFPRDDEGAGPATLPSHSLTARRETHIEARRAGRIPPVVAAGPCCPSLRTREPGSGLAMNTTSLRARLVVVPALLVFGVLAATSSALACVVGDGTNASCSMNPGGEAALDACLPGGG